MATVDLKGVYKVRAKGKTYYYAWRNGPRIKADPSDVEAFAAELAQHAAIRKGGDHKTIKGVIALYQSSDHWTTPPEKGGLAASTKKNWGPWLKRIETHFGKLPTRLFDRPEIRQDIKRWLDKWKDQPRTADYGKTVLSALLGFAVEEGWLLGNPCTGISNRYKGGREELIWQPGDLARMEELSKDPKTSVSKEIVWALKLAILTGLRRGDLLRLSWSHVGELAIEMKTGKSRKRGSPQVTVVIPLYQELKELLAEIPKRATTVLASSEGRPWTGGGFGASWNRAIKDFGDTALHFNDARGTFATRVFQLQVFTIKEIAQLLGWSEANVESIINKYVRRDALLRDKIRRIEEARKKETEG